jgi:general stress protein 26
MIAQKKKLEELYELIEGIDIAMMTTRRADGRLVSRPMATQEADDEFDLWFVSSVETDKMDELEHDPSVNLAYYDGDTREWVSVSGEARICRDRETIRRLYAPDWRIWFEKEDDLRDGGPDDPRIVLIEVDVRSVVYMKRTASTPRVLFEMARGVITCDAPDIGRTEHLEEAELDASS